MHESKPTAATSPVPSRDVVTEILQDGAQRLLSQAIEAEVNIARSPWVTKSSRPTK